MIALLTKFQSRVNSRSTLLISAVHTQTLAYGVTLIRDLGNAVLMCGADRLLHTHKRVDSGMDGVYSSHSPAYKGRRRLTHFFPRSSAPISEEESMANTIRSWKFMAMIAMWGTFALEGPHSAKELTTVGE